MERDKGPINCDIVYSIKFTYVKAWLKLMLLKLTLMEVWGLATMEIPVRTLENEARVEALGNGQRRER